MKKALVALSLMLSAVAGAATPARIPLSFVLTSNTDVMSIGQLNLNGISGIALNANGARLTNVGAPTSSSDVATKGYADSLSCSSCVLTSRTISTTSGQLTGGGSLASNLTLGLATTAVTAGSYSNATITVDSFGRLTSAASGSGGGVTSVTAGNGLSGGGTGAVSLAVLANGNTISVGPSGIAVVIANLTGIAQSAVTGLTTALGNTVNLTGAQTIAGGKTFSATPTFSTGISIPANQTIAWTNGSTLTGTSGGLVCNGDFTFNGGLTFGGYSSEILFHSGADIIQSSDDHVHFESAPLWEWDSPVKMDSSLEVDGSFTIARIDSTADPLLINADTNVAGQLECVNLLVDNQLSFSGGSTIVDDGSGNITVTSAGGAGNVSLTAINTGSVNMSSGLGGSMTITDQIYANSNQFNVSSYMTVGNSITFANGIELGGGGEGCSSAYDGICAGDSTNEQGSGVTIGSYANGNGGAVVGESAYGADSTSSAFGLGANAPSGSTAIGYGCTAGASSVCVGGAGNGDNAVNVGAGSEVAPEGVSVGYNSYAQASGSVAIGFQAQGSGIAIGGGAQASFANQFVVANSATTAVSDWYGGNGMTDTSGNAIAYAFTLHATGGNGTNKVGAPLILAAGISTGNAAPQPVHIQGTKATLSGIGLQALGTAATFGVINTKTGSGAVTAFDPTVADDIFFTATSNVSTLTLTMGMPGQNVRVTLIQGASAFSWPSTFGNTRLAGGSLNKTTTANKADTYSFHCDGSSWWETARALNE